uniref:Biotin carboxyl carrier protein of acetyl-CoA carboxylase n=1 Tax=Chenopodium quinoa TaxID=63459 RepID=A0A803ME42_CHEQI
MSSRSVITHSVAAKAQLNNASIGEASSKSEASAKETKNGKPSSESISTPVATEESISEFITQVAGLIKLVDSRDIVELQMKQHDCELLIRKKEAISQPTPPPMYMMQAPSTPTAPPQASPPASLALAAPAPTTSPAPAPPAAKSSVPPLKSPMSGTFYRSPAPNSPPFVKVGDKVQKGQVVCIIEAMKLMNEIEADQAGTVVEVVAEDGKPVSLDTPLFVIQP